MLLAADSYDIMHMWVGFIVNQINKIGIMSAMMKHFNTLEFVKKSKEFGADEQLAIFQAQEIEGAIDIAVATSHEEFRLRDLATKSDVKQLDVKIEQYRYDSLKYTVYTGVAVVIAISGMLVKWFHWLYY